MSRSRETTALAWIARMAKRARWARRAQLEDLAPGNHLEMSEDPQLHHGERPYLRYPCSSAGLARRRTGETTAGSVSPWLRALLVAKRTPSRVPHSAQPWTEVDERRNEE